MPHMPILFSLVHYFSFPVVLGKQLLVRFFLIIFLISIFKMIGHTTVHLIWWKPGSCL